MITITLIIMITITLINIDYTDNTIVLQFIILHNITLLQLHNTQIKINKKNNITWL